MKTLKDAREDSGYTQAEVANALDITRQTYARYEENPRVMPVYKAKAACEFIGCSIADIFFGDVSN